MAHLLLQLGVVCHDGVERLQALGKVIHLHGVHVRVVMEVGLSSVTKVIISAQTSGIVN